MALRVIHRRRRQEGRQPQKAEDPLLSEGLHHKGRGSHRSPDRGLIRFFRMEVAVWIPVSVARLRSLEDRIPSSEGRTLNSEVRTLNSEVSSLSSEVSSNQDVLLVPRRQGSGPSKAREGSVVTDSAHLNFPSVENRDFPSANFLVGEGLK
jgi:hypothetical protein